MPIHLVRMLFGIVIPTSFYILGNVFLSCYYMFIVGGGGVTVDREGATPHLTCQQEYSASPPHNIGNFNNVWYLTKLQNSKNSSCVSHCSATREAVSMGLNC